MVKAYSRYRESGSVGRIHCDAVGNTLNWESNGKSLYSAVGTEVVEINAKSGMVIGSVSCADKVEDESLYGSALSLQQPARVSCIESTSEYLGMGCTDGSIRIVELPLGSEDRRAFKFQGHRGSVNALAFSGTGLVASAGRDTEIVVWDMVGESGICRLAGHKGEVTCLSFIPGTEDFLVSGSKDGVVKIWSVKLQICVQTITEAKSEVWSLHLVAGGGTRLVVGSADKVLYVYSIRSNLVIDANGLTVADFHGQLDRPEPADGRIVNISATSEFLFAQTDRRVIEIWRVVAEEEEKLKRMKRRLKRGGEKSEGDEIFFTANDEFVVAAAPENPSVALRYVAGSRVKGMSIACSGSSACSVALGLGDNQIELFRLDKKSGEINESRNIQREGHRNAVSKLSVSPDGSKLVTVSLEAIIVWNAITLVFQRAIQSPSGEVVDAFFLDCDHIVLVCRDGHICTIDVNTGALANEEAVMLLWEDHHSEKVGLKKIKKSSDEDEIKCAFQFMCSETGACRVLLGTRARKMYILQVDKQSFSHSIIVVHEIPDEPVSLCISPASNKYIAAGLLNSNAEIIYADSGKHYMSLYAHKLAVSAVAFSPDEQVIVTGSSDKNIKIWSIKFGNVLKSIRAHDSALTALVFIPHSHLIFSASRDGVLSLWDIDRFERVMSKVLHPGSEVLAIATSNDAGMVFTGGLDRAIRRITRTDDQMFIEDEVEKAMEMDVDREAQREDLTSGANNVPTKSSLESVRLLDKVVQMIEIDEEELQHDQVKIMYEKKQLVKFVACELPPSELQQVIVTLPTGHARRLLAILAEVLESVLTIQKDGTTRLFPLGFPVEQCVSAGLFLIQAQAKYLVGEPHSRAVLIKLKDLFHFAIHAEIENVGIAAASVNLL